MIYFNSLILGILLGMLAVFVSIFTEAVVRDIYTRRRRKQEQLSQLARAELRCWDKADKEHAPQIPDNIGTISEFEAWMSRLDCEGVFHKV